MFMKIGALSEKTGCKVVTIRYYEQQGLLKSPLRTSANYRLYDDEDVGRLNFIMHCRDHHLSLAEIKKLMACPQHQDESCEWVGEMIDGHIREIDRQIASLKDLKNNLKELRSQCAGHNVVGNCPIVKQLHKHMHCRHRVVSAVAE